jgi:membrane peptidoglycan carboxypeptidase
MGIITPINADPAIGLGALEIGVSPLELAHAYATLANGGERVGGSLLFRRVGRGESAEPSLDPISITKIVEPNGKVLYNRPKRTQVVSREDALETLAILKTVITKGTAHSISSFRRPAAGKTGTTSNFYDAWFAGTTPQLTSAVWVGYPQGSRAMLTEDHGKPVFGGTYPAAIWKTFMTSALAGQPWLDWPAPSPPAAEPVLIDSKTGLRATSGCRRAHELVLELDKIPSRYSSCSGEYVTMPDVIGSRLGGKLGALDRVHQAGLTVRARYMPAANGAVPGTVMYSDPGAAEPAEIGPAVTLIVAKRVVEVVLPDVRGINSTTALSELRTAGFKVRVRPTDQPGPPGRVIGESPEPGTLPRGSQVTLDVVPWRSSATAAAG